MRILSMLVLSLVVFSIGNSQGKFISPIKNDDNISRRFGEVTSPDPDTRRQHSRIDIDVPVGTPVLAASAGKVIQAETISNYGTVVKIHHSKGVRTFYAHLSKLAVKKGQSVEQGAIIAYSGASTSSSAPHLHYEVFVKGQRVDPGAYLR
ncbi:MAG: M23 family metallopeptidase [Bacteroidota bacterium]